MAQYLLRRLALVVPTLLIVSVMIFAGVRVIPGNICQLMLQTSDVDPQQCAAIRHSLGLDQPAVTQYVRWLGGVLQGDLGESRSSRRPVLDEILRALPVTVELTLLAATVAVLLAVPIGICSAVTQNRAPDFVLRLLTIGWLSLPSFWVGTMLITLPAIWWGYSAPVGYVHVWQDPVKNLQQLSLPVLSLGLSLSAGLARLMRSSMLEVLRQDYVRTARAKGLHGRTVLLRHALKNALVPVVTLFGVQLGFLLGGTVILESIFALPGLGTLLIRSVFVKDYTQVQGLVLFFAVIVAIINLLVDLSYSWLDPRVRYG